MGTSLEQNPVFTGDEETSLEQNPVFTGDEEWQPKPGQIDPQTGEKLYPYLATEGLIEAVNLAIKLNRPILLEGEVGGSKTKLAQAVAYEFTQKYCQKQNIKWPSVGWYIKSTDQARDGLYFYDAVRRLYDAQLATVDDPEEQQKIRQRLRDETHEEYIKWGALGKAFLASKQKQRMIVLIDEIDKAEPDFPNDLLLELEEKRFIVKETGQEICANPDYSPIIFITSNAQKKLPDAFLRRCLYHFLEFPQKAELQAILAARFGDTWRQELTNKALNRFLAIREEMVSDKGEFGKKISLSELIDWFNALHLHTSQSDIEALLKQRKIPYSGVLIKSREDMEFAEVEWDEDEDE